LACALPVDPEGGGGVAPAGSAAVGSWVVLPVYGIRAPGSVAVTKDPTVCANHYNTIWAGWVCAAALSDPHVSMVVWERYANVLINPADHTVYLDPPQGYRIYVSYAASWGRTAWRLAATQTTASITAYGVPEPHPEQSPCYTVHAYFGGVESG